MISDEAKAWIIQGYKPGLSETRLGRQQEAQEQLASFNKLNAQLPTLSPDEKRWLKTEYYDEMKSGHFTKRALNAMNSKEYCLDKAKPHVGKIIMILTELKTAGLSQKREVFLWANLASLYLDFEFWGNLPILAVDGIVDKDLLTESGFNWDDPVSLMRQLEMNADFVGRHILNDIVLPYLSGNLGK